MTMTCIHGATRQVGDACDGLKPGFNTLVQYGLLHSFDARCLEIECTLLSGAWVLLGSWALGAGATALVVRAAEAAIEERERRIKGERPVLLMAASGFGQLGVWWLHRTLARCCLLRMDPAMLTQHLLEQRNRRATPPPLVLTRMTMALPEQGSKRKSQHSIRPAHGRWTLQAVCSTRVAAMLTQLRAPRHAPYAGRRPSRTRRAVRHRDA